MKKRHIPVPTRPDEFASLENELIEAIENIDKRTRAVENALASYAEAARPTDEPVADRQPDASARPVPEDAETVQPE